jgi:hypothetical protein
MEGRCPPRRIASGGTWHVPFPCHAGLDPESRSSTTVSLASFVRATHASPFIVISAKGLPST